MANFIYVEGYTPVNLDHVIHIEAKSILSENDFCIIFTIIGADDYGWSFATKENRDLVYSKILEHFTKIEV